MASGEMRHWGWGEDARAPAANPHLLDWLSGRLGGIADPVAPEPLEAFDGRPGRLGAKVQARLEKIVGAGAVSTGLRERVTHAAGKGYPDLVRMRQASDFELPDAVVWPADAEEVAAVLDLCSRRGIAVVPFGGGTSVVGGVEPVRGEHRRVITLDTSRLRQVLAIDQVSRVARLGAGLRGPEAEHALKGHGLTLGHFPQSFEYSTVGGWVATRSAGQASSGYGRIDDLVRGVRLVAPKGGLDLAARPASAAGPDLRERVVGSEGAFGVITEAELEVAVRPEEVRYEAFVFPGFAAGSQALRALAQEELQPEVTRLSDEDETAFYLAAAGLEGARRSVLERYLAVRGVALEGCALAVLGWEGERGTVQRRRAAAVEVIRRSGGTSIGTGPGKAWARGRFEGPYLRDELMARGVMVETLETATTWANAENLYRSVRGALEAEAPVVGCHISHVYPTGCCLYFTFLAGQEAGNLIGQWKRVKRSACEAIVDAGGTITHHHGIGADHRRYLKREDGRTGIRILRSVKATVDPAGVMNPGKLV
ncbi:MAG: FAD-binding oxidoreductase [Solirubrobacterales bacterium]